MLYTKEDKKLKHFPEFLMYSEYETFFRKTLSIFTKNFIIDISLGSKHVPDTFVNSIVIFGLLHIILNF